MKRFFLPALTLIPAFCLSQNSDYVVLHSGDSVYGNVVLKGKTFLVESSPGNTVTYEAGRVRKVHAKNIRNSTVVPCTLHIYTEDMLELEFYLYINTERDTLMILDELYSTPKMNLYWGEDNRKKQYYFYKMPSDSLPIQLYINYAFGGGRTAAVQKGLTGDESRVHLEVQKGYINQLRLIMGDCKKISDGEWEILDYRSYSLKSVIKKFNKCK